MATLVELCAGTASVSLRALAGRPLAPLTGYMGSKRRWASILSHTLTGGGVPERVLLVDAGPWGDVWSVLRHRAARLQVAAVFRGWTDRDPHDLWASLVLQAPSTDDASRVAQYLWLQARSAGTIPIWWDASRSRWESPTGARTEAAHERGGAPASGNRQMGRAYEAGGVARKRDEKVGRAAEKGDGSRRLGRAHQKDGSSPALKRQKQAGVRGIQHPATIAHRIDCLDRLPWERVEVIRGDLRSVEPIPGAVAYFDPPYLNCPRYAATCPRADVLEVAARWAAAGARVLVSEGEPLPLEGWTSRRLADREWLTSSWPIVVPEQLGLFGVAA